MSSVLFEDPPRLPSRRLVVPIAPVTTRSRQRPRGWAPRYTLLGEYAEEFRMREIYRMNVAPHLYDQWLLDLHQELFDTYLDAIGKVSFDCDHCRIAVLVDHHSDLCPRCGQ